MSLDMVLVEITRNDHGWYVATSENLPGLYVAHESLNAVTDDIPAAIAAIYQFLGQKVRVASAHPRGEEPAVKSNWWVPIPLNAEAAAA